MTFLTFLTQLASIVIAIFPSNILETLYQHLISAWWSVVYLTVGGKGAVFFPLEQHKSVREQLQKSVREYLALVRELSRSKLPVNRKKWP